MSQTDMKSLEQALDYKFKKTELMIEALTHRSHHHEVQDSSHNERLEFLGDAILNFCISESLMTLFPTKSEGDLSKLRSQLVSKAALAEVGKALGLGTYVRLGRGEDLSGGRARDSLVADTVEAIVAAVYLDSGIEAAKELILRLLDVPKTGSETFVTGTRKSTYDYKSEVQEICQSLGYAAPSYSCVEIKGPDHKRSFVMTLSVSGVELSRAESHTKKAASLEAAKKLLDQFPKTKNIEAFLKEMKVPKGLVFKKKKREEKSL